MAQQKKSQDTPKAQALKEQILKSARIDSMPMNIFKPRENSSETEKEALQLFVDGTNKDKEGDYEGSIVDYTKSLDLVKNENCYFNRGYVYLIVGNTPLALQDFTEALRISPAHKEAIFGRGIARFEMGDYESAEVDLKQYIDQVNSNPVAFNYMAALCFLQKDYQCALENYSDVIRCDSLFVDAYTNRAMIKHYLKDYLGALTDLDAAIKQTPDDKKIYNNRGATRMLLTDYLGAMKDFNQALTLDSLYADAYNNRGRVKYSLGDTEGACGDWQKAISFGIEASRDLIIKYCK